MGITTWLNYIETIVSTGWTISMFTQIKDYLFNTEGAWLRLALCVGGFIACYLFSRLVRFKIMPWLINALDKRSKKGLYLLAKGFSKPAPVAVWSVGIYVAVLFLPLPPAYSASLAVALGKLLRISIICLFAWGLIGSSDVGPLLFHDVRGKLDLEMDNTVATFLNKLLKSVILIFAVLLLLEEFGVRVDSLIASLGLAGLTISLAAKDYATNFFGGLVVIFEKPFSIGDWIACSAGEGEVEDITFRCTRIRQMNDSVLVIPNSVLVSNALTNYSKINRRLAKYSLGVSYSATRSQLEHLLEDIRQMLCQRNDVIKDTIRVQLTGFGASSIDILVQFYVNTGALADFLKIQEAINLDLMELVAKNECSFAFPSTSVYIEKQ